jgi:hypothetical protein
MKLLKGYTRLFVFALLFLCFNVSTSAQPEVKGKVLRADQNEVVPFCAIGIKSTNKGCLSNEDGDFILKATNLDTLVFSAIGYKKALVPVSQVLQQGNVYLQVSEMLLEEVTVYSNNDFVYELLGKSRKAMMNSISRSAKAYYFLETEISGQPVELLECYYTAKLNNNRIQELGFKNGRVGVAPFIDRYFVSLDISKAFTMLNLLYSDERMPSNPYQFNTKQLKKNYFLHLELSYDSLQPVYVIEFIAKNTDGLFFNGKVHVLKSTFLPLKIELRVQNTLHHPFRPLFPNSKISSVSMQINKNFEFKNDSCYVHHVDFNYKLNYVVQNQTRSVNSKGLMYFYDYYTSFYLPLFDYNAESDDYRKITGLSYNEAFWDLNTVLEYSKSMKLKRDYFEEEGLLINYKNDGNHKQGIGQGSFFENNDLKWSDTLRLSLKGNGIANDTTEKATLAGETYRADRYALKAGIFLDVNPLGEGLQHFSTSVFKVNESYYHLKEDANTNCFINIYFDLVEIERRKMEVEIGKNPNSWSHIKGCYTKAIMEIETTGLKYFKEVERGHNKKKIEEWNQKVVEVLGIDNVKTLTTLGQ